VNIYDLADFLLVTSCGLLVTTLGFAVAWVRSRERLLRFRAEAAEIRDARGSDRAEQAVEAIAVEVERIGEQQRFLTKILTDNARRVGTGERGEAPAAAPAIAPPRTITPH
jgi:hypothetical protein